MPILDECRAAHAGCNPSCVASRCRRGKCTLALGKLALCVDCDRCKSFAGDQPKPDFVILEAAGVGREARWIVVEIKTQISDVTQIVRQLQAGARTIQTDARFTVQPQPLRLVPVVVREKGRIHSADVELLRSTRISFGGVQRQILTKPCGTRLADIA